MFNYIYLDFLSTSVLTAYVDGIVSPYLTHARIGKEFVYDLSEFMTSRSVRTKYITLLEIF